MRSLYAVRRPLVSDAPTQSLIGTLQHMQMLPTLYTCSTNESITEFKCSAPHFNLNSNYSVKIYNVFIAPQHDFFVRVHFCISKAPFKK